VNITPPTRPTNRSPISSNDVKVLNILADAGHLSQRQLAERAGLSVGMVNLLLRRLTKTGYIKIVNLNRRKMGYLLTPKGLSEKSNRSYQYLLRAVQTYRQIHDRLVEFINTQLSQGKNRFIVTGDGEIADLVKLVLKNKGDAVHFSTVFDATDITDKTVVIHCDINNQPVEGIAVLESILRLTSQTS
jgi:DNA-binding Lrp family transcriptional regulator